VRRDQCRKEQGRAVLNTAHKPGLLGQLRLCLKKHWCLWAPCRGSRLWEYDCNIHQAVCTDTRDVGGTTPLGEATAALTKTCQTLHLRSVTPHLKNALERISLKSRADDLKVGGMVFYIVHRSNVDSALTNVLSANLKQSCANFSFQRPILKNQRCMVEAESECSLHFPL
jgi:hypothetical protein